MKTFETERLDIPVGATHYRNECNEFDFAWVKYTGDHTLMVDESITSWTEIDDRYFEAGVKLIQLAVLENQMNIDNLAKQTPEEKEVEWVNGDDVEAYGKLYKYVGLDPFNDNLCICLANQDDDPQCFSIEVLNKPETEVERVEREREESAKDLHITDMSRWGFSQDLEALDEINKSAFLAIVDKTNYRKDSE